MKTIAERLKISREAKGWSQAQLAIAAGVSTGTIGNIESGARQSKGSLPQIAEALGCSGKWLATGQGEMTPTAAGRVEYVQVAQKMSLHQTLDRLSELLASADHSTRETAALLLGGLARNPDTLSSVSKGLAAVLDDCDCAPVVNRKAA